VITMTNIFAIRRNRTMLNEKRVEQFWSLMDRMGRTQSLYEQARTQLTTTEFRMVVPGVLKAKGMQLKKVHLYGRKLKIGMLLEDVPSLIDRTRDEARALCPA
jgi:hypothetical protein